MVTLASSTKPPPGWAREIFRRLRHDPGVRQGHLFPQAGAQARLEHADVDHRAFALADAHVLSLAQGPRVHQDQAARALADDARRADRDHQADQHRQALEGGRVRTGQIGRPSPARTARSPRW